MFPRRVFHSIYPLFPLAPYVQTCSSCIRTLLIVLDSCVRNAWSAELSLIFDVVLHKCCSHYLPILFLIMVSRRFCLRTYHYSFLSLFLIAEILLSCVLTSGICIFSSSNTVNKVFVDESLTFSLRNHPPLLFLEVISRIFLEQPVHIFIMQK